MKHVVVYPTKNHLKVAKKAGRVKKAKMMIPFRVEDLDHQEETIQSISDRHKCGRAARMFELLQIAPRTQQQLMAEWNIHNPRTHMFHYPWSALKNGEYISEDEETGEWWLTSKFYLAVDPNP